MAGELGTEEAKALGWKDYAAILQRRRRWVVTCAFLVWAAVWSASWYLPETFRSETLILIDSPQVPSQYVVPNVTGSIQQRLQNMSEQILSRTRLLRIINENNLYPGLQKRYTPDEIVRQMRKDIEVQEVQDRARDVTAFKIYYSAPTPQIAQHITSELTHLFINENLRTQQQQSQNTTEFLQSALEQARQSLDQQEARVREFRTRYEGQLPSQLQPNMQILAGLQTQLQGEQDSLSRAKQQNLYYKTLLGQYQAIQTELARGNGSANAPSALDQELARLHNQLNDLRARDTENHPDVRRVEEQIARTEKMKRHIETQLANAKTKPATPQPADVGNLRTTAPMLEIESQLKANELEITTRQQQIKHISDQIADYRNRLNQIPLREQQMADLTRDYDQSRANYESLLAKKNQSELATNLAKRQQGEQFRMLDPPSLPEKPFSPNRVRLGLIGLAVGAFLGLCVTVVLEFAASRVYSENDFNRILPVPVLASVPPLLTLQEERRKRLTIWAECAAASGMTLVFLASMLLSYRRG